MRLAQKYSWKNNIHIIKKRKQKQTKQNKQTNGQQHVYSHKTVKDSKPNKCTKTTYDFHSPHPSVSGSIASAVTWLVGERSNEGHSTRPTTEGSNTDCDRGQTNNASAIIIGHARLCCACSKLWISVMRAPSDYHNPMAVRSRLIGRGLSPSVSVDWNRRKVAKTEEKKKTCNCWMSELFAATQLA